MLTDWPDHKYYDHKTIRNSLVAMRSNFYIISASSPLNVGQIVSWTLLILSSSVVVLFCHYRSSWQHQQQQHNYPWVSMYVSAGQEILRRRRVPASKSASKPFIRHHQPHRASYVHHLPHCYSLHGELSRPSASQPPQSVHSSVRPPLERHSSPPFPIVFERMLWLLLLLYYFIFLIHIGHVII